MPTSEIESIFAPKVKPKSKTDDASQKQSAVKRKDHGGDGAALIVKKKKKSSVKGKTEHDNAQSDGKTSGRPVATLKSTWTVTDGDDGAPTHTSSMATDSRPKPTPAPSKSATKSKSKKLPHPPSSVEVVTDPSLKAKTKPSPVSSSEPDEFADLRGTKSGRAKIDGLNLFQAEELNIGKGGDTPDCPFDCKCCY
ncbi:hypothetical protein M427DRAFT_156669 [Gonapodya prolifera JEL478]|uniref:DUF1764-domain-containing protein n=1 Tax=Gonapodya prolifera (strain JEL478) TaxID=1344416 RepID=A0A139A995_GONPJ|nr:hypothetical protein M427DRAFT_156669 [Gonapodya prolifera JEL478]|eukprot:KXS13370.1 hypothetical protein M427DRAFT_156669 [Gonapodya prolifera JEL478]